MAIEKPALRQPKWSNPNWPDHPPNEALIRILYGARADELVVRFDNVHHPDVIVVPITTPRDDYAGLMVSGDTGAVIGIHVYPLLALAVQRHPEWRGAAEPSPTPQIATRIVNDIKHLFERYGIEDPVPE